MFSGNLTGVEHPPELPHGPDALLLHSSPVHSQLLSANVQVMVRALIKIYHSLEGGGDFFGLLG